MELIISDGLSTDDTRKMIADFQTQHPDLPIQILDNTARSIPAALNRAIQAARGDIIVRLDAHSMPDREYVARCVQALGEGRGANVGGVWEVRAGAQTWLAESIAIAAAHPLGVGDAMYRLAPGAGPVDTVPFGSFYRTLVNEIGAFDERLLSNEDYEFNARIRRSGRTVWLDPAIRSVYIARSTLAELARQYGRYGFWKWRMLRRYPTTLRWRQALPPIFVFSLAALSVIGFWYAPAVVILAVEFGSYLSVLLLAGVFAARRRRKWALIGGLPLAISTMHLSWGGGFLWSLISGNLKK
jgi:succinoglycan biosynthesis protein ExoA